VFEHENKMKRYSTCGKWAAGNEFWQRYIPNRQTGYRGRRFQNRSTHLILSRRYALWKAGFIKRLGHRSLSP